MLFSDSVNFGLRKLRHAAICILVSAITSVDGSDVMCSWRFDHRISYERQMPPAASKMILNPSKAIRRRVIFFSEKLQMSFCGRPSLRCVLYRPRPIVRLGDDAEVHYSLMRVLGARGRPFISPSTSYLSIWRCSDGRVSLRVERSPRDATGCINNGRCCCCWAARRGAARRQCVRSASGRH